MKQNIIGIKILLFGIITFLYLSHVSSAFAYATFYLHPSKKYINAGGTQDIELRLNTDADNINAFSAYLTYPQDILDVMLKEYSSYFPVNAEEQIGSGTINLSRGSFEPVKGDIMIATFQLKTKKEGVAPISFIQGSAVAKYEDSSDVLSLTRSTGGFYTIINPQNAPKQEDSSSKNQTILITPTPVQRIDHQEKKKETKKKLSFKQRLLKWLRSF